MSECKRYKDVKNIMDKLVYNVIYDKKLTEPSIAFTLQRQGLLGEIYKIYVNDSNKDLAEKLFMHEAGHVIFGHVNNQEIQTKIVSDRIRITFEKYKNRMPQEEGFFDYMRNYIFNIAMDFEVNSKFFSLTEFNELNEQTQKLLKSPDVRGMWPEDYGFPIGKSWKEYLSFILDNFEKFIKDTNSNYSKNGGDGYSTKDKSKGKGKGQGAGNSSGKNKSGKKETLSQDAIESIKKNVENEFSSKKEKAAKMCEAHQHYATYSNVGSDFAQVQNSEIIPMDKIEDYIRKNIFDEKIFNDKHDILYNTNRNKYNSGILIAKDTRQFEVRPSDFYVILDVSGSVDTAFVENISRMFNSFSKNYGRHSRIIFWNTKLVQDVELSDKIKAYAGGGTDIAKGIEYVAKKYLKTKRNAKVFVISDFEDDMPAWEIAARESGCKNIYGICWSSMHDYRCLKSFKKIIRMSI